MKSYRALGSLTEVAESHAEPWRTAIGFAVGAAIYVMLVGAALALLYPIDTERFSLVTDAGTPLGLMVQIACIGLMGIAIGVVVHVFHARRARTVLGPVQIVQRDAIRTFSAVFVLLVVVSGLMQLFQPLEARAGLEPAYWLRILPASCVVLIFQVVGEEMVFRGYLLQQIAAKTTNPLLWMVLPSIIFGIGHLSVSDFGGNAIVIAIWATLFGVALADLTARTGSIGAAVGMHLANNVMAILVLALPGPTSALALFRLPFSADSPEMLARIVPVEFALVLLCWLAARLALRR